MIYSMAAQPRDWFAITFSILFCLLTVIPGITLAEEGKGSRGAVMSEFNTTANDKEVAKSTTDEKFRHQLLFFMGLMLLIFIFATAYFGLSMALFGKDVFVPHMICAGVTVFLALVHAVVAVVWFFPF